jgi:hypothetical protein
MHSLNIGDIVVFTELFAAIVAFIDSFIYLVVWYRDTGPTRPFWRLLSSNFFTLEVQLQLWNVVPGVVYVVSAIEATYAHFGRFRRSSGGRVGDLEALRLASRGYTIGDSLYFLDATLAIFAWWGQRRRLREENDRRTMGVINDDDSESALMMDERLRE